MLSLQSLCIKILVKNDILLGSLMNPAIIEQCIQEYYECKYASPCSCCGKESNMKYNTRPFQLKFVENEQIFVCQLKWT